jgi:hypothetical protein
VLTLLVTTPDVLSALTDVYYRDVFLFNDTVIDNVAVNDYRYQALKINLS